MFRRGAARTLAEPKRQNPVKTWLNPSDPICARPIPRCRNMDSTLYLQNLTCFHVSFLPFRPLCWQTLFPPFSGHLFTLLSPSKSALFCRAKGTAQILERGTLRMDLSTKFGKEIPSRNLLEKWSDIGVWWAARLKCSNFLEIFNPGGRSCVHFSAPKQFSP